MHPDEDIDENPYSLLHDENVIEVTYRHIPFKIRTTYSLPHDVWVATVIGEGISLSSFPPPITYATSDEALVAMVRAVIVLINSLFADCDVLLQRLSNGQPIDFQAAGEAGRMAQFLAKDLFLTTEDIDQASENAQQFRCAFEQSNKFPDEDSA